MTKPMTALFSESEFDALCEQARARYLGNVEQVQYPNEKGSIVETLIDGVHVAAEEYHRLRSLGFSPLPVNSPLSTFQTIGDRLVTINLVKPQAMQESDLEAIYATVRQNYELALEVERETEVLKQIEFAQVAAERKDAEDKQKARDAIAEQVRKDMAESRETLRTTLTTRGKLNKNGEAK